MVFLHISNDLYANYSGENVHECQHMKSDLGYHNHGLPFWQIPEHSTLDLWLCVLSDCPVGMYVIGEKK